MEINDLNIFESDDTNNSSKSKRSTFPQWLNKSGAILLIGGLVFGALIGFAVNSPWITGAAVSEGEINTELAQLFPQITVTDIEDLGSMHMVTYNAQGQPGTFYVTNDGEYMLVGQAINLEEMATGGDSEPANRRTDSAPEVTKSDRPSVEVFVMTYCPYGLQMEKAVLPVEAALGEYADIDIKFVHYLMHGEKEADENTRQYCMQQETPDQFYDYLECFIRDGQGKENACMLATGIDPATINACMLKTESEFKINEDLASGAQYPTYRVDKEASEGYGVGGSPTLVINGQIVNAGRTPEAVKQAVCAAFNTPPEACNTELSTAGLSPGFGFSAGAASDTSATCG
jgi:protein-disulfide isomerase